MRLGLSLVCLFGTSIRSKVSVVLEFVCVFSAWRELTEDHELFVEFCLSFLIALR